MAAAQPRPGSERPCHWVSAMHNGAQVREVDLTGEAEEHGTVPKPGAVDGRTLPVSGARRRSRIDDQHDLKLYKIYEKI